MPLRVAKLMLTTGDRMNENGRKNIFHMLSSENVPL